MVQMGTLTAQQAAAMKFPAPRSSVPQTVGGDVWDPYVLTMVWNELTDIYHFTKSQIYNGGYVIRTSIDDKKMAALYAAVRGNLATINASGDPFHPRYMHVGAVLEDPATGAIQALYPGPGYPGAKYNGTGKVITASYCLKILCENNMAVYAREQVGSSFKPYILSAAVKQGMNVQTSTLNGYNNLCIPPDSQPSAYPVPAIPNGTTLRCQTSGYYPVPNDSAAENGPYTPQLAMAMSINTAYTDLWHTVAGNDGTSVANLVQEFGVNTAAAGITGRHDMKNQAGLALGQASLTVGEQATMLATLANGGVYHNAHVITSITRNNAPPTHLKIISYPVFSSDPTQNANMASQVQYAMSKDDASYGTAPVTAMSNGQEIIGKTGTTNSAQSAFLHRRHPEPGPGCRDLHQPAGQGLADPAQPRRQQPGRIRRHLAGHDLAHLRREHVRPARRRAVPHPGLHWPDLEPGTAEPAQRRQEAQEARPRWGERRPGRRPG